MSELAQERRCNQDTLTCEYNAYRRTRYFHGMLLSDRDFKEEQSYHIAKRHLLNRMLHGWGVVCGLGIEQKRRLTVTITPGLALDCHGNEIFVCDPVDIDLTPCLSTAARRPTTPQECEALESASESKAFYIGIAYRESATAPVPAYVPGGSCNEKECDHSRVTEGFCIKIFDQCPDQHPVPKDGLLKQLSDCTSAQSYNTSPTEDEMRTCSETVLGKFCQQPLPCPDWCPEEHYIGLGKVTINVKERCVKEIRLDACRTYVLSANLLKYLVSSLLAGAQDLFEIVKQGGAAEPLPDHTDINLIHNPIEALCWWLRYVDIEDGEIRRKERTSTGDTGHEDEIKRLREDYDTLKREVEELRRGSTG
jgi:hypothetical protein